MESLILDWSGTLVDDFSPTLAATNEVFRQYGIAAMSEEQFRKEFFLPYPEFYQKVLPQVPLEELEHIFQSAFRESGCPVRPLEWTENLLKWARKENIRLFILTSMDSQNFEQQAREFGFWDDFEAIYSGVLDKCDVIGQIVSDHHLNPQRTAYVGDMSHDVDAAKVAQVQSVAVLTGYDSVETLSRANPDLILPHIGKLKEMIRACRPVSRPVSTVGALIFNEENKFLLVQSHKWSGLWGIPGGKIEYGESSEIALKREISEETGLELNSIEFVCVQDCIDSEQFFRKAHFLLLNYRANVFGSCEVVLNDEAQQYAWVDADDLGQYDLNRATQYLLGKLEMM